ncbi:MAG: glycosyltransferase [Candidatus Melainabacteria bacterium]|nr:glycosyltransferase [Candidatus Melainabacteria bacterium]
MNYKKKDLLPTIIVAFYSNPEYVSPLIDTINILSQEFNVVVIARDVGSFSYKYPQNVFLYIVGPRCDANRLSLPVYKKIIGYFLFILEIYKLIKKEKTSLLFLYDKPAFLAGYIANRMSFNLPIFYHQSTTNFLKEISMYSFGYLTKCLELFFCRRTKMLSFPDPIDAKLFLEDASFRCKDQKPIIIENCPKQILKLPKLAPQMQKLKDEGKSIILHRGPLEGTDVSEVIRSIKHWTRNANLVLLGFYKTDRIDFYKNVAEEEKVSDRVIYVPYVDSREELLEFMAAADIGLVIYKVVDLNHKYMGPTKFYDYLALGIPVLVPEEMSFISGVVKDLKIGLTYDKPVPEVIGKNIYELLEHSDRRRMSEIARQTHLSRLNYETQFIPLYEEIKKVIQQSEK